MKAIATLACLALLGCGGAQTTGANAPTRPIDEDPVALLPSGVDLLADVDVTQLRAWMPAKRLLALLPEDAQTRIHRLGFDPLADVDRVLVSVSGLGTREASSTMLLFGELDVDKLKTALGPPSEITRVEYRDTSIAEGPDASLARVSPRILVVGGRADVRRVLDLARGDGESVRTARSDRALAHAFNRCPTAKQGRPALMMGVVPPETLRAQLKKEQLPGHDIEWLAVSLAVGDGFDVGGVAGTGGPAEARSLVEVAHIRLADFTSRFVVRALGLKPFLDPIVVKARDDEADVHFAYRLPAPMVEKMLSRLEDVQRMAKAGQSTQNPEQMERAQ
jgi:hypothetical protein